jgi:predicted nucleic acid-binding protein
MEAMSIEEIEAVALKLDSKGRAKLAEKLLESLEQLSDEESARLWAEEANRRDQEWAAMPGVGRPAKDVLRAAHAKLK